MMFAIALDARSVNQKHTFLTPVSAVVELAIEYRVSNNQDTEIILVYYLERLGSTTMGKFLKLRRTQSMPISLLSLIF